MIKKGSSVFFTLRAKKAKIDEDNLEIATLLFDTGRFEGQTKEGKANGKGMFIWKDGSKFNGEWKDNYRHGRGVYLCTDGTKFDGMWKEDKFHGRGVKVWFDGTKYEGDWKSGLRHGKGVKTWKDGTKYQGMWSEGQMHGRGEFVWPDGTRFQGIWERGKCDEGTYTFALKTATLQGRWVPKITREKLVEAYYEREAKSKLKSKLDIKKHPSDKNETKTATKDDSALPNNNTANNSSNKRPKEAEDVKKGGDRSVEDEPKSLEPNDSPAILRNKNLLRQQSDYPQESPGSSRNKKETPPTKAKKEEKQ